MISVYSTRDETVWAFLAHARLPKPPALVSGTLSGMTHDAVVLVTGANKGIGREVARRLAELGKTVLVGARERARGEATVADLRAITPGVHLLVLDTTDDTSIARAASDVTARFGGLDILVNNAAIASGSAPASQQTVAAMRELFATNVFGVVAVTQAFLPLLAGSPSPRIVNVSTSLGSLQLADPNTAVSQQATQWFGCAASKTALNAFTVRLASELRATPIKVNSACPRLRGHRPERTPRAPYGPAKCRYHRPPRDASCRRPERWVLQRCRPHSVVTPIVTVEREIVGISHPNAFREFTERSNMRPSSSASGSPGWSENRASRGENEHPFGQWPAFHRETIRAP